MKRADQKKKKSTYWVVPFYKILGNTNLSIVTEGKQVLPGDGGERLTKQNKETLWGDGYFQHHDCRDGFKGTHKHQNLPNCTRYTCVHKLYSNKVVFYKKKYTETVSEN